MIKLSKAAAEQIKKVAQDSGAAQLALRIAAKVEPDGSYEYGMGFDEPAANDKRVQLEGVDIVVSPLCADLLEDAVLDYVALEDGSMDFIFFNPNDPSHKQPKG